MPLFYFYSLFVQYLFFKQGLGRVSVRLEQTTRCVIGVALLLLNLTKHLYSLLCTLFLRLFRWAFPAWILPHCFAGCGVGPTYLFLLLRPAWRFPSLAAFRQAERTAPTSHCPLAFNHKSIQVFMSPAHFSEALAFSSFAAPARFVNSGIIRSSRWYVV